MFEVNFTYHWINTIMYWHDNKFQDISEKYGIKIDKNINKLLSIYGGKILKRI